MPKWDLSSFGSILVVVMLIVLVIMVFNLPGPSDSLEAWTEWAGKVVGILVAARVFWAGARFLEHKAGIT